MPEPSPSPSPNHAPGYAQSQGALWSDPSCDQARERFRQRPRGMTDKVMTVAEAVKQFVQSGEYLALGGFGADRVPVAVAHEIVRQRIQNLTFAGHTATHDFQILCAGNLTGRGQTLARVDAAYIVGLEARGLSPHARRVMESGTVACVEWSNYALAVRFKAAAMGVPFLPIRSMLGTDTFTHSAARIIPCPFTGIPVVAVPALYPDVAAIHVHECDIYGNCRIQGVSVADLDLARAAHKVIITCEQLIPHERIQSDPTQTVIPFFCVDAVCEVPYGSYPGNMAYAYDSDEEHLQEWLNAEMNPVTYAEFLERELFSLANFDDYLQRRGGLPRLRTLRRRELRLPTNGIDALS